MNIIEVTGLSKQYSNTYAIRDIELSIRTGEFFGCFGPNGAGKTTLLKILTGQLEPTKGTARVRGIEVKEKPISIKRIIGIVPEFESPPSFLTPEEYLYFVCDIRNVANKEQKIQKWLKFFELEVYHDKICKDLSKGE
jgi:ABC-2 type transport system ATP-binding protein